MQFRFSEELFLKNCESPDNTKKYAQKLVQVTKSDKTQLTHIRFQHRKL